MKKILTFLAILTISLLALGCSSQSADIAPASQDEAMPAIPSAPAAPEPPVNPTEAIGAGVDDISETQEELNTDSLSDIDAALGDIENI